MPTFNNGEGLDSVRTKINAAIEKVDGTSPITSADINGGTIDGTVIGGTTPAEVTGTTITGSTLVSTGNITVTGTVDGRDVAADGTKLDGIEAGADVTDTANVTAAGAVMDSELTNEAAVKALDQGVSTTDNPTFAAATINGNITVTGTVDGRDVAADGVKLDTVETNADVTDTANVTAAGAVMDSELTNEAAVKALDQGVATTDSPTFAATTINGNITVTGTVDGRDLAADGTKLDGIEAGATADQTPVEIKTAYESNLDTNAYTDAEKSKLAGIEAGADVTDVANVTAAGALMDSELTNITAVKALDQGVATTDSPTFAATTINGNITVTGTVDGRDVAADGTKLDGIEAGADVTDATNVEAAGAVMESDTTTAAMSFVIDEDTMVSNLDTKVPTQQSVKAYVDGRVASSVEYAGGYNAATNTPDLDTSPSGITKGDMYTVTAAGTFFTIGVEIGDVLISEVDNPSVESDWTIVNKNLDAASIKTAYESNADTNAFTDAEQTKLSGIEAGADVTDTANVTAAGAVMDSELTNITAVKALDQGVATTDSPTFAGGTFTGNVSFGDNDKAIFGAGSDLQIYHDGSNSIIEDVGTGGLFLSGASYVAILNSDRTEYMLNANQNGSLQLYYDGSKKFETTSTGVDVTGTVTADGLTVDGDVVANGTGDVNGAVLTVDDAGTLGIEIQSGSPTLLFKEDDTTNENYQIRLSSGDLNFQTQNDARNSAATKMTLDASGNLGIGTSSPSSYAKFTLQGSGTEAIPTDALVQSNDASTLQTIWNSDNSANYSGIKLETRTSAASGWLIANEWKSSFLGDLVFRGRTGASTSAEAMRIDSSGNVGIGTNSPASALDVNGTVTADGLTVDKAGSPSGKFSGNGGSGEFALEIGQLGTNGSAGLNSTSFNGTSAAMKFQIDGTEAMRIASDGSVGIGTDSPQKSFVVSDGGAMGIELSPDDAGQGYSRILNYDRNASAYEPLYIEAEDLRFSTGTSAVERMRIDSSGNTIIKAGGELRLNRPDDATYGAISHGAAGTGIVYNDVNGDGHHWQFAGSEKMTLDASGNLLVGTTVTDLHTTSTETGSRVGDGLTMIARGGLSANIGAVGYFNRLSTDGAILDLRKDGTTVGSIGASGTFYLASNTASGAGGIRFGNDVSTTLILPSTNAGANKDGDVSLGYSGSRFKDLYLSGGVKSGGTKAAYKDTFIFTGSATNCIAIDNSDGSGTPAHIGFFHSGTVVGSITTTASATAYNTSSDYRLKENVVDLTGATDRIKQIPVHRFNFIADPDATVDGFLAHEVQEIVPEAVTGTKDAMRTEEYEVTPAVVDDDGNVVTEAVMGTREVPDYQGIDQSKLVPLLTAALQEALTEIAALKDRVAALEA